MTGYELLPSDAAFTAFMARISAHPGRLKAEATDGFTDAEWDIARYITEQAGPTRTYAPTEAPTPARVWKKTRPVRRLPAPPAVHPDRQLEIAIAALEKQNQRPARRTAA